MHEMLRFLDGTQIRTYGNFHDIRKSQLAESFFHLGVGQFFSELSGDGRCHHSDNRCIVLHCFDGLIDLTLIHDSGKRTGVQAHAAGNALFLVNFRMTVLILVDGVDSTGFLTRALLLYDGVERAHLNAAAALDALVRIDDGTTVLLNGDGILRADLLARMFQAALTSVGHRHAVRTAVAGEPNDIDERRFIVLLGNHALIHAL